MDREKDTARGQAYTSFKTAVRSVEVGTCNLQLVRLARRFSDVPKDVYNVFEYLILEVAPLADQEALLTLAEYLYNWNSNEEYRKEVCRWAENQLN